MHRLVDETLREEGTRTSFKPVLTKKDFVRRYALGEFGNASPTWSWDKGRYTEAESQLYAYDEANPNQRYHVRSKIAGGPTHYDATFDQMLMTTDRLFRDGSIDQYYVSVMCPTLKTSLQGEVMRTPEGLYLYYSQVKKPMREALKEKAQEAKRLTASYLLKKYLNPASYDWLETLLDRYPDHVVEFTALEECWGTWPEMNTLFWEVRKY